MPNTPKNERDLYDFYLCGASGTPVTALEPNPSREQLAAAAIDAGDVGGGKGPRFRPNLRDDVEVLLTGPRPAEYEPTRGGRRK